MELNIETLTKEQRKQLDMWYKMYLNEDDKLVIEEPTEITPEFIEYKTKKIETEFKISVSKIKSWYSQEEIDAWAKDEEQARLVLSGWTSTYLEWCIIKGETVEEFAEKIMVKVWIYETIFSEAKRIKRQKLKDLED